MSMLTGRFANPAYGGSPTGSMWFHVGANADQRVLAYVGTMTVEGLSFKGVTLSSPEMANAAIVKVDAAMNKISKQRADLGAYQSRFELAVSGKAPTLKSKESLTETNRATERSSERIKRIF
jgi:flagellin